MVDAKSAGQPVYVRFDAETLAEIDTWLEEVRKERPGMSGISRSDLIRDVVLQALGSRADKQPGKSR